MAVLPATASGPVSFTSSTGNFISIPLTSIAFNNGQIEGSGALYTANKTTADALLAHLAAIGYLQAGAAPPVKPAMVIQAKTTGPHGNFIQIEFFEFDYADPLNPKFKARVTETVTYPLLTPETLQAEIGSAAGTGLLFVTGSPSTELPKPGIYPLAIAAPATSATAAIPKNTGSGDAFTVEAREAGADGELTAVEITALDTAAKTFTLIARWAKETPSAIAVSALGSTFAYEIEVTPPEGAAAVAAPSPGVFTLSGGAEVSEARKASSVISG